MASLYDRVKMSTATTGTGTITLGSAATGYRSFATAGVADGEVVAYGIDDGSGWEVGTGTYTVSGTTLSRTVSFSSNSNTAISLSGGAFVFITARTADIANVGKTNTFSSPQVVQITDPGVTQTAMSLDADGGNIIFSMTRYYTTLAGPVMIGQKARGSRASPAVVQSGDLLFGFRGQGYDGSSFVPVSSGTAILFRAAENWGVGSNGTQIAIQTTLNGTATLRDVAVIGDTGAITITGSLSRGSPVTKTADFTVAVTENNLINNKSGSSCTVTLPSAASFPGREILIKNSQAQTVVSASSNVVPLITAAAGTAILASGSGKWAKLVSDGTNWVIMAGA